MNGVSAPVAPPFWTIASRLTTSKYSSNPPRSRPACASPNSHNIGLQLHLWVHLIMASDHISNLSRSQSWTVSLSSLNHHHLVRLELLSSTSWSQSWSNSLDQSLQVQISVHSNSVTKCISKLGRSSPPSRSLRSNGSVLGCTGNGCGLNDGVYIFGRPWGT